MRVDKSDCGTITSKVLLIEAIPAVKITMGRTNGYIIFL